MNAPKNNQSKTCKCKDDRLTESIHFTFKLLRTIEWAVETRNLDDSKDMILANEFIAMLARALPPDFFDEWEKHKKVKVKEL